MLISKHHHDGGSCPLVGVGLSRDNEGDEGVVEGGGEICRDIGSVVIELRSVIERMTSKGVDIVYGRERAKGSTPPETSEAVIDFLAKIAAGSRVEGIRNGGRMSQEANNAEICANVKVPVLILSGEKDNVIPSKMHSDLLEALPEAQQYVFPDAGHASYAEYPDQFTKHVKKFATRIWR